MSQQQIIYHDSNGMGCDPELFLATKDGKIIGAEKVIPAHGLTTGTATSKIILDGVQVEFNPRPSHCRPYLGDELRATFTKLRAHLKTLGTVEASFRTVVEIDKAELDSLSDKAKQLGCAPSNNLYDQNAAVTVSGDTYNKRSAGGHIHLDLSSISVGAHIASCQIDLRKYAEELVPLHDCFVGLPSVFIDRDPLAPERRKVYGRAGEYRLPCYGLEYRTLSNFWLRSYQLMSLVFGLSRLAIATLGTKYYVKPEKTGRNGWDAPGVLMNAVDLGLVRDAINQNDIALAKRAFDPVKQFIREHVPNYTNYGVHTQDIEAFEHFCKRIEDKGLEYWFPQDPVEHWCKLPHTHGAIGSEAFFAQHVRADMTGETSPFRGPVY